jgi:hypothetical protein
MVKIAAEGGVESIVQAVGGNRESAGVEGQGCGVLVILGVNAASSHNRPRP